MTQRRTRRVGTIAPQKNASRDIYRHPLTSRAGTVQNMNAVKKDCGGILGLTESWSWITRSGVRSVFESEAWGHHFPWKQSAIVLWSKALWRMERKWVLPGHPAIPGGVSDNRKITAVLLRSLEDPDLLVMVIVVHPTPIPTKKAPWAVDEAHKMQKLYWGRVEKFIEDFAYNYPVWVMGDFNDAGHPLGVSVGERAVRYYRMPGDQIIQHAFINGRLWVWDEIGHRVIEQPKSDHAAWRGYMALVRRTHPAWN